MEKAWKRKQEEKVETHIRHTHIFMCKEREKLNLKADLSESMAGVLGLQE